MNELKFWFESMARLEEKQLSPIENERVTEVILSGIKESLKHFSDDEKQSLRRTFKLD